MSKAKLIPESELNIAKNIKTIAQEVLLNQSGAVENLVNFTDKTFDERVKEFYSSKGRFIITGIGESPIKANKIVPKLNLISTPCLFMPPAATIHGELRIIQREDIVICISASSTTPETKVLVPSLKRRVSTLVALVYSTNFYLAQQADYLFIKQIERIELLFNGLWSRTTVDINYSLICRIN